MSLAVCVLISWCAIAVLALIPKKLSTVETVFLFFVCTIFELSVFTIFHLNLHWIMVNNHVEQSLADLVIRLVCVPVELVITSNFMLYSSRPLKFVLMVAVLLVNVLLQKTLEWLGILFTSHWHLGYTALLVCGYIVFVRLMTFFITHLKQTEGEVT
ncbi:hypothetical protein JZ785_27515 (plasmid) [Alicyclobacillus curvatus]|nr:hypothetical protein JZ785_27515 [Alicyclobacillus curvatus]